jgi:hypothetical protein
MRRPPLDVDAGASRGARGGSRGVVLLPFARRTDATATAGGHHAALFSLAVVPQAVSIHPYIFDFGLIFPAAFCLWFWMMDVDAQQILAARPALMLSLYIVLTALIVTGGIDLARSQSLRF